MHSRRATLLSPQSKRLSTGLPRLSKNLREGIKALEDFGFRAEAVLVDSPQLSLSLRNTQPSRPLVHVTDLWSTRQQKEFLVKSGLRRAQFERERLERKEAFRQAKDKIEGVHMKDQLYLRLLVEDDPLEAAKLYAAGSDGQLMKQLRNQLSCNCHKRLSPRGLISKSKSDPCVFVGKKRGTDLRFEELLTRCDDTMQRNVMSRQ